jgi:iron complex outermembrane recepter protein
MKTKTTLFLLIFFLFAAVLKAQVGGKISGEIKDAGKQTIDNAIVALYRVRGMALVKTVITDSAGKFEFTDIKNDTLVVVVTNAGYQKFTSTPVIISQQQGAIQLPVIELKRLDAKELTEVTVVSKLPFVEKKIDRTIINPDALISNAGSNALEVLEKAPGVQVDANGVISLKGRQGVVVYIDDKPTYLSADDLANYLRSLPSGSIGVIEIMTNPPAKYDAAGNAGVINIKLKKSKTKGFNGGINTNYGQGVYARSNNSINLNYRINKVNFFTNAGYNINNTYQDLFINRAYFKTDGSLNSLFNQNSYIKRGGTGTTLKLGMDYYINKKSTLGIVFNGFKNTNRNTTTNRASLFDSASALQNTVTAISPIKRVLKNGSVNLNYGYKFDATGRELTVNLDQVSYGASMNQSLLNTTYLPNGAFVSKSNLLSDLPANIDIQTAKLDYSNPLKKNGRFEAGLKTSFINTSNVANFYDEANSIITPNYDFSNNFRYRERINAAYLNVNFEHKQLAVQAGLRFENTGITGRQTGNPVRSDSSFARNYNSFFPTLYVTYKLDTLDRHQLGFSYGRRINRPNYQDMNPFTYPLDRFTLYSGNPFLQPSFSDNIELTHTYKNSITTTLQYSYTRDVINETIEQSSNTFFSRPGNIGKQVSYSISVSGAIPIAKWWTLQLYTELSRNEFKAKLYNQDLNNAGNFWFVNPTSMFQISKTWAAELSGTYQTSVYVGQFVTIPVGFIRAGISKKILKNQGSIKMNVNDLFFTNQPGGDIKSLANSTASWLSFIDTRVVTIAFGYRFSKGKTLNARKTGGSDSERERVK